MRWFDTRRFGITVYRYLLDEDAETVVQITDQISDENGTPDPRRALQLPADVIAAGLTPQPEKIINQHAYEKESDISALFRHAALRSADGLFGQRRPGLHQRGPADDHRTERPRPLARAQLRRSLQHPAQIPVRGHRVEHGLLPHTRQLQAVDRHGQTGAPHVPGSLRRDNRQYGFHQGLFPEKSSTWSARMPTRPTDRWCWERPRPGQRSRSTTSTT